MKELSKKELFEQIFNTANLYEIYEKKISSKPSVGIDGCSIEKFNENALKTISTAITKIKNGSFKFSPYLEEIKSKGKNKPPRIISKPTTRDRIILSATLQLLQARYQDSVKKELPNQIIRKIKEQIQESPKDLNFIKLDIKGFYDNINQKKLTNKIKKTLDSKSLKLITAALENITVNNTTRKIDYPSKNTLGVPQGLCISNILSDIYLDKIDIKYSKYKYQRYVDDILIISESNTTKISKTLRADLSKLNLDANEKTAEGKVSHGLEYLGYVFKGKHTVSVRHASKEKFIRSLIAPMTRYKKTKSAPQAKQWLTDEARITILIETLNEKITGAISEKKRYGWIFYFIEITDMKLLHEIDSIIRKQFSKIGLNAYLPRLKRLTRAYHEATHNTHGNYIHNYNKYESLQDKINYLITMGTIDPDSTQAYSQAHIERLFDIKKSKNLLQLDVDLGSFS